MSENKIDEYIRWQLEIARDKSYEEIESQGVTERLRRHTEMEQGWADITLRNRIEARMAQERREIMKMIISLNAKFKLGYEGYEFVQFLSKTSPLGTKGLMIKGTGLYFDGNEAFGLIGEEQALYQTLGGPSGVLGFPSNPHGEKFPIDTPPSPYGTHGLIMKKFEAGAFYWSEKYGYQPVWGSIKSKFDQHAGTGGKYGFPTEFQSGTVKGIKTGQIKFENGIYSSTSI